MLNLGQNFVNPGANSRLNWVVIFAKSGTNLASYLEPNYHLV